MNSQRVEEKIQLFEQNTKKIHEKNDAQNKPLHRPYYHGTSLESAEKIIRLKKWRLLSRA